MTRLDPPPPSTAGYYPDLVFPSWFDDLDARRVLTDVARLRYLQVDEAGERPHEIEEAFDAVLGLLTVGDDPDLTHHRMVRLGLIMAMACCWPLREHEEWQTRAQRLHQQVEAWLTRGEPLEGPLDADLFPRVASRHQELDEAKAVHRALSLMPGEPERARALILDILDLTLDGFAIRPGYDGARDLFHWWLGQAVPAAMMAHLPDHIWNGFWPWPPRPYVDRSPS